MKKIRLKASGGTFSQNRISTNDDTDVVSLFTGFLSSTDNIPSTFQNSEIKVLNKLKIFVEATYISLVENLKNLDHRKIIFLSNLCLFEFLENFIIKVFFSSFGSVKFKR